VQFFIETKDERRVINVQLKKNVLQEKLHALSYMTICRVLSQFLILFMFYSVVPYWAQLYSLLLGFVFLASNMILWKERLCTEMHKRLFIWVETGFLLVLFTVVPFGAYFGFFMIQLVTVCLIFQKTWERNSYAMLFVLFGIGFSFYHHSGSEHFRDTSFNILFSSIFCFAAANAIRKLQSQKAELEILNRKLEEYAEKVQELTITEERNRLARDIHDTVAHQSTGLIMQLQAAKSLSTKKPDQVEAIIDKCLEVSRHMLDEMRNSVRALSPVESRNLLSNQSIQKLINNFADQTNMSVQLLEFGTARPLEQESQVAIYRAIQEGLTNAKRHGDANDVRIVLKYLNDRLHLNIEDNGQGCENVHYGFGLAAMKERLSKLKGKMIVESKRAGLFKLKIELPYLGTREEDV
jgi:signal transduction histidine kinase